MTQENPALPSCEVIILTALPVEYQAVVGHLQELREIVHTQGTIYHWGSFTNEQSTWRVAVAEIGMHGPVAAVETERAIAFFRPSFAFFVGVAGGLKDVQIGDVVVATKVYSYEAGKSDQSFKPRPELWRTDHTLEQRARAEARDTKWLLRLGSSPSPPRSTPRAFVAPIVAGEKVAASQYSPLLQLLRDLYSDALAIEMEGHGFSQAVHANQGVGGLIVRGISDLIERKAEADASGSQQIAAWHAAAFAFQVLAKLMPFAQNEMPPPNEEEKYRTEDQQASPETVWNVPFARNPFFTGRGQELEYLSKQLHQQHTAAVGQTQSISGLGGIGKTQLVVEYAYRHRRDYKYILWFRANSTETLNASYLECATLLNLPEREAKEQETIVRAVKTWFQIQYAWLLILDNADEPEVFAPFLPSNNNGHLLLTTRAADLTGLGMGITHSLEMTPLPAEQGAHFLLQRANLLTSHTSLDQASLQEYDLALQIAHELGNLPLALDQAGAYLAATRTRLSDYLSLYRQHRPDLLKERRNLGYSESVATTWNLSFEGVEARDPAAAELLRLCALLGLDTIPEEVLTTGAAFLGPDLSPVAANAYRLSQAIEALHAYSLARRNPEERTLTIHRLVQAVLQDAMDGVEQLRWAERAMLAVNAAFPEVGQGNWLQCERLLPQALAAIELIERYQLSSAEAGRLLYRTILYLRNRPRYAQAEPLYQRTLQSVNEPQQDSPDINHLLNHLARLYQEQGQYMPQAEPLHQQAWRVLEQQLGLEYADVTSTLNALAETCQVQGKYIQAEALYQQALHLLEQQLGPEHPDIAFPLGRLADLHRERQQYIQAEQFYRRALHILEQQLGSEHPLIASLLNNLANLYYAERKYLQAEPLYQQALRLWEQQLNLEHPFQQSIQTTRQNYASLLRETGRSDEAQRLEEI